MGYRVKFFQMVEAHTMERVDGCAVKELCPDSRECAVAGMARIAVAERL